MNQMKQTKSNNQPQTNKESKKMDAARLYDEWNNSWELYKPYRTLNNY